MTETDPTRRSVLRSGVSVAAAAAGITAATGGAVAHFPRELDIDVKPDAESNPVNPRSNGTTSVAVFATDEFDPTSAAVRYRFGAPETVADGGGATPVRHCVYDVNGDGSEDLVVHFRTAEAGFESESETAELRWDRDESREHGLSGRDSIRTVGPDGR
ncbi:hypothetical protein KTS45_08465 [Halomicroarcula limicola]|uniref:VCBS repeat-containing protein n=1 Tax=Haloarcula limicola TaxID=1429915 RepID=A0A8J7Y556_9EURY|nr:hypothetical protein [Halomicroarcula limicola]MBV0924232.1 hypothetical protein [Halomicroarcula limicola]